MNGNPRFLVVALATCITISSSGCATRGGNVALITSGIVAAGAGAAIHLTHEDGPGARDGDRQELNLSINPQIGTALIFLAVGLVAGGTSGLTSEPRPAVASTRQRSVPTAALTGALSGW